MTQLRTTRRQHGREKGDRDIKITYDGLARADGSARFGFGDTTVALASVSGPIEVRLASELPSKSTFEVILRPLTNVPITDSKHLSTIIRASLEPCLILTSNPRTLIQLVIQSLKQQTSMIWKDSLTTAAAMINASSLALLNSGSVYMRGVVSAVAIGRLLDGTLVIDPDEEDEKVLGGGGCFAFMFIDGGGEGVDKANSDCVWSSWKSVVGGYDENELFSAREMARVSALDVYFAMKKSIDALCSRDDIPLPPSLNKVETMVEDDSDDDRMEI